MISNLDYDHQKDIVRVTISGDLVEADFRDALQTITSATEFRHNVNVVWDLRSVRFYNVDASLIRKLSTIRNEYAEIRDGARAAIVVPGEVEGSLVKLIRDLAQMPAGHLSIVTSIEEAETWCVPLTK